MIRPGPIFLSHSALNHVDILCQVLLIGHVSLGLCLLESLLKFFLFFDLINDVKCSLALEEVRSADLEDHPSVDLLLEEGIVNETDNVGVFHGL